MRNTPASSSVKGAKKKAVPAAAPTTAATKRPDDSNWDQRLGFLMHDVSRLRRKVFDELVRPMGVTRSQWWVLAHLARHDGMIQSDLAGELELGKAALGSLVDRLEASGLIRRGADKTDRRVKRVYLSAQGSQLIKDMLVFSQEMSERILEGLGDEDRHALANMLGRVKHNLLSMSRNGGAGSLDDEG
jgi:MarR family transcriptional regulator, transcriptional regulator for hemolysin